MEFNGIKCWGCHMSFDAKETNDKVRDKETILLFGKTLIEKIDMIAHGDPQIEHFGKDDKKGWTYSQLISTSNICCHFCDDGSMYLDVFSCKPFDATVVKAYVEEVFEPKKSKFKFFLRGDF
jgi:hypothetical protein